MINKKILSLLQDGLARLDESFSSLPDYSDDFNLAEIGKVISNAAARMADNYPYFHPLYAGQMLKPPHPVAHIAYMLSMWINPNNHALDGGRASSQMEKEAVADIAKMFDWDAHLGHLTGGGTMANLEALWIAGQLNPGKKILASDQAHYTHSRLSKVLRLKFESVTSDNFGKMDLNALEDILKKGGTGTVVATMGTTAIGAVDPLTEVLMLQEKYGFRIHADAAYGGYFRLAENLSPENRANFLSLSKVDSIVIDPHKHGLQPYGCGCVLFRDPAVGSFYKHESPYTYFSSDELHLGEISLECSRPGASAVALWATMQLMPLVADGEFAGGLCRGRSAAVRLYQKLTLSPFFFTAFEPELDIVFWVPAVKKVSEMSIISEKIFTLCAKNNLHLALAELPVRLFDFNNKNVETDSDTVTCLRSVLMKPEHAEWVDEIFNIINDLCRQYLQSGL